MSESNPFDDTPESDRTVIRPMPGGRARAETPRPRPTPPLPAVGDVAGVPEVGASPLLAHAAPLIQLLGRLGELRGDPDPGLLREQAVRALQRFETAIARLDLPSGDARWAHYVLCASLDDVVMATAWGRQGAWEQNTLVAAFHRNVVAGEGFFDLLKRLRSDPVNHLQLLELMYYCLSLGFQGQYRVLPRGTSELETLRQSLYEILRQLRQDGAEALSPHWRGEQAPYEPLRASMPAWVLAAGVVLLLVLAWLGLSMMLARDVDGAFAMATSAAPAMPTLVRPEARRVVAPSPAPPPPPRQASAAAQVRRFLEPEIRQGLVTVTETATTTRVQVRSSGMFASGSATVQSGFLPLLQRIGEALNTEPGAVTVIGHTDNQPIRTVRFPSNLELSVARAQAARAVIGGPMREPGRLAAEGMADSMPVAGNDTAEGRELNRRIEIVLQRQE